MCSHLGPFHFTNCVDYEPMRIALWIITIASLLVPHYKSSNLVSILMNQSMRIFGSSNSCRIGLGESNTMMMDSLSPGVPLLFTLSTCMDCLRHIFYKVISDQFLDYRNQSQMENACKLKGDSLSNCMIQVRTCCMEAEKCCSKQLEMSRPPSRRFCPMTWDGLTCIDETPANVTIKIICPKFISYFYGQRLAEKQCLENGTWFTKTKENITWEFTDYDRCISWFAENEYLLSKIKASILIVSLVMLLISLCIFVFFKSLRSQQRIRIHINFFITMFLNTSFELMNTVLIGMNIYKTVVPHLTEGASTYVTILEENKEACKWITILLRYFQNSTFCWMLCEALFLYQLLFRTFEHIPSIKMYLCIGWVVPSTYTLIYLFIRRFHPSFKEMDSKCWVDELPKMEYLMRGPNIIVMLINIILLINILCLIRNLPAQPSDTSYRRRTLKAVLILVPLFGLHFILVAFQIEKDNGFFFGYSLIQNMVHDSQGIAVSLAFCAMNQEVYNIIKQKFHFNRCNSHWSTSRNHSLNRYSNSSRNSDNSRMIRLVQSNVNMTMRRSDVEAKVAEQMKIYNNEELTR